MSDPQHTLYRFFDTSGQLLYVGRTVDARSRWRTHERTKEWFAEVASVTRQTYPDAESVDAAERAAIASEAPLHNISLNPNARPRPLRVATEQPPVPAAEVGDAHSARLMALGYESGEVPNPCGESDLEARCECADCHLLRMKRLDCIADDYMADITMAERISILRRQYVSGDLIGPWLDDLFDLTLFRRLELVERSRIDPIPALASVGDAGLDVGCPFCLNIHEHFMRSGDSIGVVQSGCDGFGGDYLPVLDLDDYHEGYAEWLTREQRRAAA